MTIGLTVFVLFIGIDIGSGCACITRESEYTAGIYKIRNEIENEKEKNGVYPTYDELSSIEKGMIKKYDEKGMWDEGFFYAVSPDRKEYILRGYLSVEFFGVKLPIVKEVKK